MVNQIRPFCAIGAVMESSHNMLISALQGVWLVTSDILVNILEVSGGVKKPVKISWPDQVFYGVVCSWKDTFASQVSIVTATVNGIVQASVPLAQMQMGQAVDNKFLATFSMSMTAITNFIYSLCLAPIYIAIAIQKSVVCQTSSLVGLVTGNNQVTIGDPDIQRASNIAAGSCLTQAHTENSQGTNSGVDNNAGFVSASGSLIKQLGGVAISMPLDSMKHATDCMFTYILGVLTSLQDVLATVDQKK
jgi:hypothetical protein